MVDVVLLGVWVLYCINKDEHNRSLLHLAFPRDVVKAVFLKYSKEGRLSSTQAGIRNIPSDSFYDDTKHYQIQYEHRRIQNPFKRLRLSVTAQTVNSLQLLTDYAKTLHLRYLQQF